MRHFPICELDKTKTQPKARIAIVGSGLSSALLAKRLGEVADVTVFERGTTSPQIPIHREIGRPLGLSPSYGFGLGGTTNYWSGGLLRLRSAEIGYSWPDEMVEALQHWEKDAITLLYGAEIADAFARDIPAIVEGSTFIDHILRPSDPFRASRSGYFNDVHLKLRHEVVSIREDDAKAIVSYRVGNKIGEDQFDAVVLAAGAFGSPLILSRSGLGGRSVGHNVTDHPMGYVAKFSASGPNRFNELMITRDLQGLGTPPNTHHGSFKYQPMLKVKDAETGLWTSIYLHPTATSGIHSDPYSETFGAAVKPSQLRRYRNSIAKLRSAEFRSQALSFMLNRTNHGQHAYVLVIAEQEQLGQGRIFEKEGVVHLDWSISEAVAGSIKRSIAVAAEWAGATAITYADGDIRNRLWSGAHHSGSCRISYDPSAGVVDANLRVHGTRAVYVCDGSVLPSTGATNSALAISCLALRLADYFSPAGRVSPTSPKSQQIDILVTGAGGNVGSIVVPALKRSRYSYDTASLRGERALPTTKARTLIHLANDYSSLDVNREIQQRAMAFANSALVECVVVPMSFATLQLPGPRAGDPDAFNFGFDVRLNDPYIDGKLEVERVWCDWQSRHPDRAVVFLYVPTICGHRNFWSPQIASSSPEKPMWVPSIRHFFSVTEENLATAMLELASSARDGVQRRVIFDRSDSLAKTVEWERGTQDVREFPFPLFLAGACRVRPLRTSIAFAQKAMNKALDLTFGQQIMRTPQPYIALFREQVRAAGHIHNAAERSRWQGGGQDKISWHAHTQV
jgi:hypothetical protein